jgi:hypothetical protein
MAGRMVWSGVRETTVRVRRSTSVGRYRLAPAYAPRIIYEYQVGGLVYRADRLQMGPAILTSAAGETERQAARYPIGGEVTVYYNPAAGWGTRLLWLTALLVLIIAIAVIAFILSSPPITAGAVFHLKMSKVWTFLGLEREQSNPLHSVVTIHCNYLPSLGGTNDLST